MVISHKDTRKKMRSAKQKHRTELWVLRKDTGADIWYMGKDGRRTRSKKQARKWQSKSEAKRAAKHTDYEVWTLAECNIMDGYV